MCCINWSETQVSPCSFSQLYAHSGLSSQVEHKSEQMAPPLCLGEPPPYSLIYYIHMLWLREKRLYWVMIIKSKNSICAWKSPDSWYYAKLFTKNNYSPANSPKMGHDYYPYFTQYLTCLKWYSKWWSQDWSVSVLL